MRTSGKVFLAASDPRLGDPLRHRLEREGFEVVDCGRPEDADLALCELPGARAVLERLSASARRLPLLAVALEKDADDAVFALRSGARDYLVAPFAAGHVERVVREAIRRERDAGAREHRPAADLVFRSEAMQAIVGKVEQVKDARVPVLLLGESGTGKELLARLVHGRSQRAGGPFVAVNCAVLPREMAASELFGHVKGAYTGAAAARDGYFAQAEGGTIFLDEIAELPGEIQAKLLRVLQEGEITPLGGKTRMVDTRVVAATNRDLKAAVRGGEFRQDLYYRLNVITLRLPPLRDRREDIGVLAQHLLDRFAAREGLPPKRLSADAIERLERYDWPGNVRQLQNTLWRTALLSGAELIEDEDVVMHGATEEIPASELDAASTERLELVEALATTRGNVAAAAKRMGIGRATFYRRAKRYGVAL